MCSDLMKDITILKKVAAQELAAEKRYAEQVSRMCDGEVKEVLAEIKDEENRHKRECVVILKSEDSKFNADEFDKLIDMELNTLLCSSLPDTISFIELDIEKELEAAKLYEGYATELKDPKFANMLTNFMEDEKVHVEKLHEILNKLKG
jgi:rubrerythrin